MQTNNNTIIDTTIFKSYDIRGIYPTQLNEDTAYKIGRAYAVFMQNTNPDVQLKIAVSNDMRLSSPQLKGKLIQGLIDQGVIVYDLGFNSTPSFYFGVSYNNLHGGVQVSASHNPKEYNGFKMVKENAKPISGETGINQIKQMVIDNNFTEPKYKGVYRTISNTTKDNFEQSLKNYNLSTIKPIKIVVDAANSMGILDLQEFFKHTPQLEIIKVNYELDGNLPSHDADPLKLENLKLLQDEVLKNNADLGISPDGDGDRYFFVDDKGQIIRQEILRGIMAQIELKQNPNATVCYDIRPGKITEDMIKQVNGKYILTKVGHSLIKQTMIENDAVFGGESSGHYFYKTPYGTFESPALLLAKFLHFISDQDIPVSQVIKPYQIYFNSGEINTKVTDIKKVISKIKDTYKDGELNELDGITITYKDFWFNVRPSNTEPVLRLTLEAITEQIMQQKTNEILDLIKNA